MQGVGRPRAKLFGGLRIFVCSGSTGGMTVLSFEDDGVEVVYEGTEFRLEKSLIEEATEKPYPEVTDHEVLKLIEREPALSGEPRRVADILD